MAFSAGFTDGSSRVNRARLPASSSTMQSQRYRPELPAEGARPARAYSALPWLTLSSAWTC
jgi:hypothetical protein